MTLFGVQQDWHQSNKYISKYWVIVKANQDNVMADTINEGSDRSCDEAQG